MRFSIISEIPGRTRLQLAGPVPESDLDALLKLSGDIDGVHKVRVYGCIGQMALEYDEPRRASVLDALGALDAQAIADAKSGYVMQLEPRKHKLVMDLATLVGAHYARRWFLPTPLRAVFVVAGYMAFLRAALHELAQPRLTVPVLDASAIGISFAFAGFKQLESLWMPLTSIGIASFVLSLAGSLIGVFFGKRFHLRVEIFGGLVLIGIGIKILVEHLFLQ